MKDHPRVLVVSNNSFSKSSSNGRTLGNLFIGWPKDKIAQFCISTTEPDYDICDNYYLLTDKSMLNAFKRLGKGKRCEIGKNLGSEGNTTVRGKKVVKTPLNALIRHYIWSCKRWYSLEFKQWINNFSPEVVLVMNSDATFILDVATTISKERNIPLVMYNTEGFYFFKSNYYRKSRWFSNGVFKVYQTIYKRHFRTLMSRVSISIHLNSLLAEDFRKEFGGNHMVIYTGSSVDFDSSNLHLDKPIFSYLGNFGFDRPSALIDIAQVLQMIDSSYKLDIYGKAPRPEIERKFKECNCINYKGMIPYEDVIKVMHNSTILFHAEVQTEAFRESLRYGFSTKIADSISCGHPFLMYSSPNIAGAKYILDTGAGWQAKDKEELKNKICSILYDDVERQHVLNKARSVSKMNHNLALNAQKIREVLNNDLRSYNTGNINN